jgi:hypothetical protein
MAESNKSQQRGETVAPQNPPNAVVEPELSKTAVFAVPGMFYYLAPVGIIILVIVMALMFWNSREDVNERAVPTTGIEQEAPAHQDTPGGNNPEPRHNSTESEQEYRGGDRR